MTPSAFRKTLLTLTYLAAAGTASAGTLKTWSGAGANNNWSTANNWTTAGVPSADGTTFSLVYSGTRTKTTSTNDTSGSVSV